jgi:hypothetical protein
MHSSLVSAGIESQLDNPPEGLNVTSDKQPFRKVAGIDTTNQFDSMGGSKTLYLQSNN